MIDNSRDWLLIKSASSVLEIDSPPFPSEHHLRGNESRRPLHTSRPRGFYSQVEKILVDVSQSEFAIFYWREAAYLIMELTTLVG